jgi:uncharacterized membrane-anchored protein
MQVSNVPPINARYWTAIIFASMCGANAGDFFSEYMKFGNLNGVPPLLILFLGVLVLERKSESPTQAYYWLAIIVLRTMATNLADYATQTLKLGYPATELGLSLLLVITVSIDGFRGTRTDTSRAAGGVPQTNSMYWLAMLIAGTLGTASGDYMQGHAGFALGSGLGSVVTVLAFLCVLTVSLKLGGMSKPWYWATIVAARTAITDLGDFLAGHNGLKLGLPVSLTCTSLLLTSLLMVWKGKPDNIKRPIQFTGD